MDAKDIKVGQKWRSLIGPPQIVKIRWLSGSKARLNCNDELHPWPTMAFWTHEFVKDWERVDAPE